MKRALSIALSALIVALLASCEVSEKAGPAETTEAKTHFTPFGAGNVTNRYNPEGIRCMQDHGNWTLNGGVTIETQACSSAGLLTVPSVGRKPKVTGTAASQPVVAHRWWGSVTFFGEEPVSAKDALALPAITSDIHSAAYITPDPVLARISNKGARIMHLPAGLKVTDDRNFMYANPDLTAEVFDGIAIGNSAHPEMSAVVKNSSDASVTVEWQSEGVAVMEATFVHGSPYLFFKTWQGQLTVKTLHPVGEHTGIFHQTDNQLGLWTQVETGRQNFLLVGEGETHFSHPTEREIEIVNSSNELTLVLLPSSKQSTPSPAEIATFAQFARQVIANVTIDYQVNSATNEVTVSHSYYGRDGEPVETLAGLQPLHWKNLKPQAQSSSFRFTPYQVRSARGVTKFASTHSFHYTLPFIGVLPALPTQLEEPELSRLQILVEEFLSQEQSSWNPADDTYWSGKNYGKVAELAAIARAIGMTQQADTLIDWLKAELEDWFRADTSGALDSAKYFVYDEQWHTLLGVKESFGSHRMLNDHHFHYGYFVRAAAEICRIDPSWCSKEKFGPMVELLIRDFAAGRDDPLFPYLRHFDPANGFSWASGSMPYFRGNNNESTSEAANAYGAMILYGLVTEQPELVARGTYLHASTTATYWQYWNDIDGYLGASNERRNFPEEYKKITTSIIWGDGALFDTWFSHQNAHILGIQGLPANPLIVHVAQYKNYMADYVTLGLQESANGKPSGLKQGYWKDIWWSLWAMNDAEAAIADYNTVPDYKPEEGETKAHTYHWLHSWKHLGQLISGTGSVTADHPATMVFENNKQRTYVAYNFARKPKTVTFSDGTQLQIQPNSFAIESRDKRD